MFCSIPLGENVWHFFIKMWFNLHCLSEIGQSSVFWSYVFYCQKQFVWSSLSHCSDCSPFNFLSYIIFLAWCFIHMQKYHLSRTTYAKSPEVEMWEKFKTRCATKWLMSALQSQTGGKDYLNWKCLALHNPSRNIIPLGHIKTKLKTWKKISATDN